jgi:hypothetical protein
MWDLVRRLAEAAGLPGELVAHLGSRDGSLLPRLGSVYDIVFYCCDNYAREQAGGR